MNWLDAFIHLIDLISEMTALLRGLGMNTEYVPLIAILLLTGGVLFWLFVILAVLLGVGRTVRRVFWWIGDMHHQMTNPPSGGSLPHVD